MLCRTLGLNPGRRQRSKERSRRPWPHPRDRVSLDRPAASPQLVEHHRDQSNPSHVPRNAIEVVSITTISVSNPPPRLRNSSSLQKERLGRPLTHLQVQVSLKQTTYVKQSSHEFVNEHVISLQARVSSSTSRRWVSGLRGAFRPASGTCPSSGELVGVAFKLGVSSSTSRRRVSRLRGASPPTSEARPSSGELAGVASKFG
jgi:hypothetical protein